MPITSSPPPSRLPLLLLPALVLATTATVLGLLVFGRSHPFELPLLLPLLALGAVRQSLSAAGTLLGLWPSAAVTAAAVPPGVTPLHVPRAPRTAVLLPIFNEPPEPIARAVRIMSDALRPADDVSLFILSDTQDPVLADAEAALFPPVSLSRSGVPVRYRRRVPNTGRKAGNIAEFCATAGRDFDFAVILDADSLMSADAIRALITVLRDDPAAALVQANSFPIGGRTLWARMQQFGARLGNPMSVAGQHLWQGGRGTYWGHNAILRLKPFTRHAVLPVLPGRAPLGGEILCHDTVEAALLLRADWRVRLAPEITQSFETVPSNLIDHLARERRWSQGNLQHLRLLPEPGFKPESRLHILNGILYYLSAPLGLLLTALLLLNGFTPARAAAAVPGAGIALLLLSLFLLFGPKLAAVAAVLLDHRAAARFGGRPRFLAGVLLELVLGTLLAPINTLSVSGFVCATLCGRVVSWNPASRGDRTVPWSEAWRRFRIHTAIGAALVLILAVARPHLLPWFLPVVSGLLLSVPLAVATSSVRLGLLARRLGLFLTEDELFPHPDAAELFPGLAARPGPMPLPDPVAGISGSGLAPHPEAAE